MMKYIVKRYFKIGKKLFSPKEIVEVTNSMSNSFLSEIKERVKCRHLVLISGKEIEEPKQEETEKKETKEEKQEEKKEESTVKKIIDKVRGKKKGKSKK